MFKTSRPGQTAPRVEIRTTNVSRIPVVIAGGKSVRPSWPVGMGLPGVRRRRGVGENFSSVQNRLAELEDLLGVHGTRNAESDKVQQRPNLSREQDARQPARSGASLPLITANPERPPDACLRPTEMAGDSLLSGHSVEMLDGL